MQHVRPCCQRPTLTMFSAETYPSICSLWFDSANLTCMYLFFFFASFNNHAFHYKTLVLWEVTSFPRSLADKNFVTGFKSFSLVKPLVASYHSIVKFCAVKINFSPYVLNAPPLSDQFSFMLVTSSPFESKHTSDAFTSTLDLRP